MSEITIVVDDKVGVLADIAALLAKAKINIESVNADVLAGTGVISLGIGDRDAENARRVLESGGYRVQKEDSIIIKLPDKPGELSRITAMLAKEGISIDSVHTVSRDGKNTMLSMKTKNPKRASLILKEYLVGKED